MPDNHVSVFVEHDDELKANCSDDDTFYPVRILIGGRTDLFLSREKAKELHEVLGNALRLARVTS